MHEHQQFDVDAVPPSCEFREVFQPATLLKTWLHHRFLLIIVGQFLREHILVNHLGTAVSNICLLLN